MAQTTKKKSKQSVPQVRVYIKATTNNTLVTVTDSKGGVLTWSSCGSCGFKGSKKSTAYAAQIASQEATEKAINQYGAKTADVFVGGIGQGRDGAIRAVEQAGVTIKTISDQTGVPHGGCRPKKARRG